MSGGSREGGPAADINITPMIDVLLVLLIIFMVVQQSLQKGVSVQVPPVKKDQTPQDPNANPDQIVLEVKRGQQYFLNQQHIPAPQLQARLTEVYAPRPRKVIFMKGDEDVTYGDMVYAVDVARASGIEVVGLVPRTTAQAALPNAGS